MGHLDLLPAIEVLNDQHRQQYEAEADVLRDDLVYLHTNLSLALQLNDFDADLFEAPTALLDYLASSLVTECALICPRLWKDKRKSTLTLDRFADWLLDPGVRPKFRAELQARLTAALPAAGAEEAIERLRSVRHARLAHVSRNMVQGLSTPPAPVPLDELRTIAHALGTYFNAMSFGAEQTFVLLQFYSASGNWQDGELGYVLERLALGSRWLKEVDEFPHLWQIERKGLGEEPLRKINELRQKHNKHPLR